VMKRTIERIPQRKLRLKVHRDNGIDTMGLEEKDFNYLLGFDRVWDAGKRTWRKIV